MRCIFLVNNNGKLKYTKLRSLQPPPPPPTPNSRSKYVTDHCTYKRMIKLHYIMNALVLINRLRNQIAPSDRPFVRHYICVLVYKYDYSQIRRVVSCVRYTVHAKCISAYTSLLSGYIV